MGDNCMHFVKARCQFRHGDVRLGRDGVDQEIAIWLKLAAAARATERVRLKRTRPALMRDKLHCATRAHPVNVSDLAARNTLLM